MVGEEIVGPVENQELGIEMKSVHTKTCGALCLVSES